MVKLRFAPSPTGYLHVGNVRTALINWLFVQKMQGEFILRIDDTDAARSKPEFEEAIYEDLAWLGLQWSRVEHQSKRFDRYREAMETLKQAGRLYPCYETAEELEIKRKMQMGRGLPPVYDRAALKLTEEQKKHYEAQGTPCHWRFKLSDEEILWHDLIRGEVRFQATTMSDPVLVRADGVLLYTLASVVDDGDMQITHVVRGEDHVSNTAVQVQLYEALGFAVPTFAHTALLKTKDGELSKRTGGGDIRGLRAQGVMPLAICSLLAKIGTSDPVEAASDMQALIHNFDFNKFGRAPANFDEEELMKLNEKMLRQLPYEAVKDRLPAGIDQRFWESIRGNITSMDDVAMWVQAIVSPLACPVSPENKEFLKQAADLLPAEPWSQSIWDEWMAAVKPATGRKGKELFMPLRLALTGMEHGPELKILLPLLGREKTLARLG